MRSSSSVDSVERVAAEREARGVDEDVDAAELLDGRVDEALAARRVGDVELERDDRCGNPFDPAGAADDARALARRAPAPSPRRCRSMRR